MNQYAWNGGRPVVVRTGMYAIRSNRTATESLLTEAREVIWSVNGRQPVFLETTLKDLYDQSMARTSFTLVLLAIAGGMSLVLGIVGIYGVIAYAVSQRTRDRHSHGAGRTAGENSEAVRAPRAVSSWDRNRSGAGGCRGAHATDDVLAVWRYHSRPNDIRDSFDPANLRRRVGKLSSLPKGDSH
jgi:hypothetical protein